jgi:HK97 family phage prohead protease
MPRAFSFALDKEDDREINLLFGHDFDKPLASRNNGSLVLTDGDDALSFTATIAEELLDVTHIRDALALLASGLVTGISPGFRVPPKDVVKDPEPGNPGVFIRTLLALVLYELSLVTRPAYSASQAELRAMQTAHPVRPERIILP